MGVLVFFFKQKTAYEMRISDWSSDVCSSDLFGSLLKRSPHAAQLVLNPMILSMVEEILVPACDRIQLNVAQAIEIHPGEMRQFPHRDHDMWQGEKGNHEYLVNVIWPLTSFTRENEIGRAHVCTPVTHAPLVCRLLI